MALSADPRMLEEATRNGHVSLAPSLVVSEMSPWVSPCNLAFDLGLPGFSCRGQLLKNPILRPTAGEGGALCSLPERIRFRVQ